MRVLRLSARCAPGGLLALVPLAIACRAIVGIVPEVLVGPDASVREDARAADVTLDAKRRTGPGDARVDTGRDATKGGGHDARPGDAATDVRADAGDAGGKPSCPTTQPTTLFSIASPLASAFVGGDYVYATVLATNTEDVPGLFTGFVGCAKSGCGGTPQTLASYPAAVDGVAFGAATASDAGAFFTLTNGDITAVPEDAGKGAVRTADLDGGARQTLAAHLNYPFLVTIAGTDVYWTDDPTQFTDGTNEYPWTVWHASTSGGAGAASVLYQGALGNNVSIFTDATTVYTLAEDSVGNLGLFACARSGCGGQPTEVVADLPTSSLADNLMGVDSFASDGVGLFDASFHNGTITVMSLSTHVTSTIVTGLTNPANLTIDGTYAYWTSALGEAYRVRKDGTGPITPLACGLTNVTGMAIDAANAYILAADPANVANTAMLRVAL
jgi:hypothetical protein